MTATEQKIAETLQRAEELRAKANHERHIEDVHRRLAGGYFWQLNEAKKELYALGWTGPYEKDKA